MENRTKFVNEKIDMLFNRYIDLLKVGSKDDIIDASSKTVFFLEMTHYIKSLSGSIDLITSRLSEVARYNKIYEMLKADKDILEIMYKEYIGFDNQMQSYINDNIDNIMIGFDKMIQQELNSKRINLEYTADSLLTESYNMYKSNVMSMTKNEIFEIADDINMVKNMYSALHRRNKPFERMSINTLKRMIKEMKREDRVTYFIEDIANFFNDELTPESIGGPMFSQNLAECVNELIK